MKRRVIKQGNNTLTLTLPRAWAKQHGISAGDELDVEEAENKLVIHSSRQHIPTVTAFHIESGSEAYLYRILRNLYTSGAEELELTYDDHSVLALLQKYSSRFLGWEYLEQDDTHCRIKNYASYDTENFHELYKKSFAAILSMAERLLYDAKLKKKPNRETFGHVNDTVHRFVNYCRKMLMQKPLFSIPENRAHSHILTDLLIISTHYYNLTEHLNDDTTAGMQLSPPVVSYAQSVGEYFQQLYTIFLQRKTIGMHLFAIKGDELYKAGLSLLKRAKSDEVVTLHYLITIARFIRHQGGRLIVASGQLKLDG